jgi:hypothetical protein
VLGRRWAEIVNNTSAPNEPDRTWILQSFFTVSGDGLGNRLGEVGPGSGIRKSAKECGSGGCQMSERRGKRLVPIAKSETVWMASWRDDSPGGSKAKSKGAQSVGVPLG